MLHSPVVAAEIRAEAAALPLFAFGWKETELACVSLSTIPSHPFVAGNAHVSKREVRKNNSRWISLSSQSPGYQRHHGYLVYPGTSSRDTVAPARLEFTNEVQEWLNDMSCPPVHVQHQ